MKKQIRAVPALTLGIFALAALAPADPAMAISRYNSPKMACEAIRDALRREGAVILRYPSRNRPDLTLYDRYVRNSAQCPSGQYADRAHVPARDTARCPVLQCQPLPDPEDGWVPRSRRFGPSL